MTEKKILQTELWLNTDKLSSRTLDFIRSEGNPRCCNLGRVSRGAMSVLYLWFFEKPQEVLQG